MKDSRAAIRYAKAVLDLAVQNKAADLVEKDVRVIAATIADNKELSGLLASPVVKSATKKKALVEIFKGSHQITLGLVDLLIQNKRISMLEETALKYIILNEQLKGQDVAFVTTALPLTPELEKSVLKKVTELTGSKVTLENKVDETIIGGFVLRIGDLQYDASIANTLSNLKREFTNSL